MIVKVQMPMFDSSRSAKALVYSQDRGIYEQFEVTPELEKRMDRRVKVYFHASMDRENRLHLGEEAGEQPW